MRVDQAQGLRELVRNFESKGFKMCINEKGEIRGVRKGKMIKGAKSGLFKLAF